MQPRAYKRTTVPAQTPAHPGSDRAGLRPGQRRARHSGWSGTSPTSRTGEGWLYLATVIDLATRMVVGWQLADTCAPAWSSTPWRWPSTPATSSPTRSSTSDRGTQYTSARVHRFCKDNLVRTSVGRTGVCWDNAAAESFFSALKNEMYYRHTFPTRARARFAVADYIEVFYNRRRLHSTLGYRTPFEALTDHRTSSNRCLINNPRNCPRSLTHLMARCATVLGL